MQGIFAGYILYLEHLTRKCWVIYFDNIARLVPNRIMEQAPGDLQIVYMDDLLAKLSRDKIETMRQNMRGLRMDRKRVVASTRYILRNHDMLSIECDYILACSDESTGLGIRTMILNARIKTRKDLECVVSSVDEIAGNVMPGYSVLLRFYEIGNPEKDFPKYMEALRPLKKHNNLELCAQTDWLSRVKQETLESIISDDRNLSIGIVLGDRSLLPEKYYDLIKQTSATK